MTYTILKAEQNEQTITTTVEYNFDGTIVTVDVAHFAPQSVKEINQNIENRALSEQKKLDDIAVAKQLLAQLI